MPAMEVVHCTSPDDRAERNRRDHRAAELRQVEQPDVNRAVAPYQAAAVSAVAETEAAAANSATMIPATGIELGEHRADRQQRLLGAVLVDDQDDDRRQAAE